MSINPPEDVLFHGNGKVAHAGQSEVKLMMRALGGKERLDIEGVYSTLHRYVPNFEHLDLL